MAKTHKIIAVELQAHGHSDNRDGRPITFEQDADDVAALLQQLHMGELTTLKTALNPPAALPVIEDFLNEPDNK